MYLKAAEESQSKSEVMVNFLIFSIASKMLNPIKAQMVREDGWRICYLTLVLKLFPFLLFESS
jgi:hypothetical protein